MWVEPINLGKLIPDDDPLRKINRVLKLDFVREGTPWDAYEVTNMARRIAALILLQSELDKNYEAVKVTAIPWSEFTTA